MFLSQQTLLAGTSGYLPAWTQTAEGGPYRGGVIPAESISAHTPREEGCGESLLLHGVPGGGGAGKVQLHVQC